MDTKAEIKTLCDLLWKADAQIKALQMAKVVEKDAFKSLPDVLNEAERLRYERVDLSALRWINLGKSISSPDCDLWIAPEDAGKMPWDTALIWMKESPKPWMRLPTRDELNQMYVYHKLHGGGFKKVRYWSSSEYSNVSSWNQQFSDGAQYYGHKDGSYAVRYVTTIERAK
jgi:hypothetical protein